MAFLTNGHTSRRIRPSIVLNTLQQQCADVPERAWGSVGRSVGFVPVSCGSSPSLPLFFICALYLVGSSICPPHRLFTMEYIGINKERWQTSHVKTNYIFNKVSYMGSLLRPSPFNPHCYPGSCCSPAQPYPALLSLLTWPDGYKGYEVATNKSLTITCYLGLVNNKLPFSPITNSFFYAIPIKCIILSTYSNRNKR